MKATHPFYLTPQWRAKRVQIMRRDGYRCVCCGADVRAKGAARVDHIIPLSQAWHLRLTDSNLRTLCVRCDNQRHAEKGRGVPVFGCDPTGQPRDPAHWWNTCLMLLNYSRKLAKHGALHTVRALT